MDKQDNDKVRSAAEPKAASTIAAAACWWIALFVLLIALTIESLTSAPGQIRLLAAGLAAVALGIGFFMAYARRPATRTLVGLRRFNAVMLWLVAAGAAAFVLMPSGSPPPDTVTPTQLVTVNPGVNEAQLELASKKTFTVTGMVCQSCVETVTESLLGVPGVLAADVELETGRAVVSSDPGAAPPDTALVSAVVAAGYKAWPRTGNKGEGTEQTKVNND